MHNPMHRSGDPIRFRLVMVFVAVSSIFLALLTLSARDDGGFIANLYPSSDDAGLLGIYVAIFLGVPAVVLAGYALNFIFRGLGESQKSRFLKFTTVFIRCMLVAESVGISAALICARGVTVSVVSVSAAVVLMLAVLFLFFLGVVATQRCYLLASDLRCAVTQVEA
jgi:hypothetical protein